MSRTRERIPHVDDPVSVGRRLRAAREAAGLSQRELAFPGCSAAYISRIERGERVPSLQVLRELAQRCVVSEEHLAWGHEDSLDEAVSEQFRALVEAAASGSKAERRAAYAALGRAANRAARTLRT
ncbi:MAG: helix-turn-helix domain-containing protein [Gaiellaceae bacterium]|jgi:transcriptional regulator with XRE-family HTH domain